jgi:hypothetical protein
MDSFTVSQPMTPPQAMPMMGQMQPPPALPTPNALSAGSPDIAAMLAAITLPKPKYDPGYKPPKKPKQDQLWGDSTTLRSAYQQLINRWWTDRLWLRMHLVDLFQEDILKRNEGGIVEEFQSTKMVADWNMICAFGAGLPFNPTHRVYDEKRAVDARKLCDAVRYMREMTERRHSKAYGTELSLDEWRILTTFGRLVGKVTLDMDDVDFPPRIDLLDPSTVFFRTNGTELTHAYHRYITTYRQLIGVFGEPNQTTLRKLKTDHGDDWMDCEVEALDYYDSWYRSVTTESCVWLPLTPHEYGFVPFVRQMGPFGESPLLQPQFRDPLFKNSREEIVFGGQTALSDTYVFQGLSYIHYTRRSHQQFERVMARVIASFIQATNPALIHEHDPMNPDDRPAIDTDPGMVNTIPLGDKVAPIGAGSSPLDTNTALTALTEEQKSVLLPPIFGGYNDVSNVSGSAANAMTDAGQDKVQPWMKVMERYYQQTHEMALRLIRNLGHQVGRSDVNSRPSPFTVPSYRPRTGENPSVEVDRELIDRVSNTVVISLSAPRKQEMLAIANTYAILTDKGWATDRQAYEAVGGIDFDRMRQEWMEDKALKQALDHPKFVEGFTIPMAIRESMMESEGNPEAEAMFNAALDWWFQNVVQPNMMQQQQAQMGGMPQPGAMPGQLPQGAQPPQVGPGGGPGVSFQDLGQGPGTQGGPMGGPQPGPMGAGADGSPPPGSGF